MSKKTTDKHYPPVKGTGHTTNAQVTEYHNGDVRIELDTDKNGSVDVNMLIHRDGSAELVQNTDRPRAYNNGLPSPKAHADFMPGMASGLSMRVTDLASDGLSVQDVKDIDFALLPFLVEPPPRGR